MKSINSWYDFVTHLYIIDGEYYAGNCKKIFIELYKLRVYTFKVKDITNTLIPTGEDEP